MRLIHYNIYVRVSGDKIIVSRLALVIIFSPLLRFCLKTGLLEPSTTECPWLARLLPILVPHGAPPNHTMNLTLINAALMVCGPLREDTLCIILLLIQASTCALGVTIHGRLVRWGK